VWRVHGAKNHPRRYGLLPLPVGRLPGVGKVTEEKLVKLGIKTVGELRRLELSMLEDEFGRYGMRLYELARGIDDSPVVPDRPTQSISVEDIFITSRPARPISVAGQGQPCKSSTP
jgi:DNA polymerase IV